MDPEKNAIYLIYRERDEWRGPRKIRRQIIYRSIEVQEDIYIYASSITQKHLILYNMKNNEDA